MAVRIPTAAELGYADPRPAGRLPQYPSDDPGALAQAQVGKGLQAAGGALIGIADEQRRKASQVNEALATADLEGNLIRTREALKVERDPEKIEALKGQLSGFLDRAGATITDPETRQLWSARARIKLVETEAVADSQHRKVYSDHFLANSSRQLDEQARLAAQASDPADRDAAKRNIGNIIGSMQSAGVIDATKAQNLADAYGQDVIVGHANWLAANNRAGEAFAFLQQNGRAVEPGKLRQLNDYLRPRADKEVALSAVDGTAPGARTIGRGDAGDRVAARLRARGWSDEAIVGALNNSITESSLRPDAKGAAGERGLFQFHPSSHIGPFEKQHGGDWSPEAQADYMAGVVEKTMPGYKDLRDSRQATTQFLRGFEKPKDQSDAEVARRHANESASRTILGRVGGNGGRPPEVGTFYNPDDKERSRPLHYERAGRGWKIVEGPAQDGGKSAEPTEAELDAAPVKGEAIPLDGPVRTDWRGWLDRIEARSDLSAEQKEIAKAEVRRRHSEFNLGQAEAASDLALRISKGEASRDDIEVAYNEQRISPEKRTQFHLAIDKVEEERRALAEGMARVGAAGNGGPPLDPKTKADRDALNYHFGIVSVDWPAEQVVDRSVNYAQQYGLVPEALKRMIHGGLHSGRPDQIVLAADTVERLRLANPQLVGELGDDNDMRLAGLVRSNTTKGMAPEQAVKAAVESLKVDKTLHDARVADFRAQRGKGERERIASDDKWIAGKQDSWLPWVADPRADPVMRKEFEEVAEGEFVKTGDLETARTRALDTINRVWGRSRVGSGGNIRYMRHAPEKFYGVPTLSPDANSDWMNEQLIEDVKQNALAGSPITADRLLVAPSEKTAPDGRPAYEVMLKGEYGYERVFRWVPNWDSSPEYKRRQKSQADRIEALRERRNNPKPAWDFLLHGGATLQEQMSRGPGEQ